MSVPPAPPRKNKHLSVPANGSGHNAAARLRSSPAQLGHDQRREHPLQKDVEVDVPVLEILSPRGLLDEIPETIIGENVVVKGELKFDRLLRINGLCTGKLISKGNLIIGPQGKVVGDIDNMGSLLVDGKVEGNINVEVVCLRNHAQVFGDISCKSITIDPEVIISGKLNIHPQAPKRIGSDGKVATEEDPAVVLQRKLEAETLKKKKEEETLLASLDKAKETDVRDNSRPVDIKTEQVRKEEERSKAAKKDSEARAMQMKIEEEQARKEKEEQQKLLEEEKVRAAADEARLRKEAEDAAAKLKAEQEEVARKKKEEEQRLKEEEEEKSRAAAEDAAVKLKAEQEEEARKKEEEEEEEQRLKEEEELSLKEEEEKARAAAEEARRREEEAVLRKKEEEAALKRKEEEERANAKLEISGNEEQEEVATVDHGDLASTN